MTRIVMLEIGGLGFVRSIRPNLKKMQSDIAILVVDEVNSALWLWMGSSLQHDKRRTALAKAEEISAAGYHAGDLLLGKDLPVIVIDQDLLESPETQGNYALLKTLFEGQLKISSLVDRKGTLIYAESQATPSKPAPVRKPTVAPEPTAAQPKPTTIEKTPQVTPTPRGTKFALEAALVAILRVHQELHIQYKVSGATEEITIETIDGLRHTLKRHRGKIAFDWDSKTPKSLKDRVAIELKQLAG
jgi:hypothetical protein